jgi:transcriptional regulator with XRE-family HTH domain
MNYQARALADALRATRGSRSLRDIAQEIPDVSVSTLSRLENESVPDVQTLIKVCEWMHRPITDFIKKTESNLPADLAAEVERQRLQIALLYHEASQKQQAARQIENRIKSALHVFENEAKPGFALSMLLNPNAK